MFNVKTNFTIFRSWAMFIQRSFGRRMLYLRVIRSSPQIREQRPLPKVRCMGSSHSWTPHFADDGAWMLDTSGINHVNWSADRAKEVWILYHMMLADKRRVPHCRGMFGFGLGLELGFGLHLCVHLPRVLYLLIVLPV